MIEGSIEDLDPSVRRWLELEQTLNERLTNDVVHFPIDRRSNTVRPAYYPERRGVWPQEAVWLPQDQVRVYGAVAAGLGDAFGHDLPHDRLPLFLHPQPPPAHRQLAAKYGRRPLDDVWATPTSSYRTVLAWRRARPPVMLKLSIGAVIGRTQRRLRENQIARSVLMATIFETIPAGHSAKLGFDWFPDPSGAVETVTGHGWLLRRFPGNVGAAAGRELVPMFSLIAKRGDQPPLLTGMIRASGEAPESFVLDRLIAPYVEAAAYLLFVQGIQIEAHAQNTLVEIDERGELTRRLAFRDLSDTSVSIPLRIARRKALPVPGPGVLPADAPFPLAGVATDYACNFNRATLNRAFDTVERYGLWSFVWALNTSLARDFPGWGAAAINDAYLARWQEAAGRYLGVLPMFTGDPKGLATDEALAHFLTHTDWQTLGLTTGHSLPDRVDVLRIGGAARQRGGPIYDRVECAWGDLFLIGGRPVFFRPAF